MKDVTRTCVRCSVCSLVFKSRIPKGGDGSGWFPAFHKRGKGLRCEGSYDEGTYVPYEPTQSPASPKGSE